MTKQDPLDQLKDEGVTWRNFWRVLFVLCAVGAVLVIVGLFGGWFSGTAHLAGFQHSQEQTTAVLDDWNSLQAAACNAANAKTTPQSNGSPTLVEDPALAYKATYRRIQVDYNRRMSNFFEAAVTRKLPIPAGLSGLPKTAPPLPEAEKRWC